MRKETKVFLLACVLLAGGLLAGAPPRTELDVNTVKARVSSYYRYFRYDGPSWYAKEEAAVAAAILTQAAVEMEGNAVAMTLADRIGQLERRVAEIEARLDRLPPPAPEVVILPADRFTTYSDVFPEDFPKGDGK